MKNVRTATIGILSLLTAINIAACGGGGSNTPASTAVVSQGVITAKGSVFVNGVEFSTTGATITIDDKAGTDADLKIGMVVKVRGAKNDTSKKGSALQIEARDALEGTITNVNAANNTITVMGQTVRVEDNVTRLNDDDLQKVFANANFLVDDHVEVHGFLDDQGGLRATRIVKKTVNKEVEAKGFVVGLPGATSFNLALTKGGAIFLVVNFAGALPAGVIDGSFVEVKSLNNAAPAGVPLAVTASLIHLEDKIGNAGEDVEVEGFVSSFTSAADFVINGRRITTGTSTVFVGGVSADIAVGVKLEAEGPVDANGNIAATKVTFKSSIKIEGNVTAVGVNSATVLGLTITGNQFTKGALPAVGDHVEVRAILDRNGKLLATRIVTSASSKSFLQGPVTAFDATAGTLNILGIALASDATTEWRASSTSTEAAVTKAVFFSQLTDNVTVVKVKWNSFVSTATAINEAEIELGK